MSNCHLLMFFALLIKTIVKMKNVKQQKFSAQHSTCTSSLGTLLQCKS